MATVRIPEQKVILCGEYGVGKSSIFRRFTNNTFVTATDRKSTLGLDHYDKTYHVCDRDVKLQLWDTGGMERVASITSSYYKFAEAAILVFSLDNSTSFHILSQHLLDIVTYAENAKIFLCGNKSDLLEEVPQVTDSEIEAFCEQCHNLISGVYKTSCKTNEGIEDMFSDIAFQLVHSNRSRLELQSMDKHGFKITNGEEIPDEDSCLC
ncbi:ras-related protein Rab-30 [Aethina tumida]|uniref:ras-related protein Rab-30 n=1 Tax=Aethina tumida TaxID=116153 RepID=UPI00096B0233|nr:ras-related protein Rab-30 [Aethina tumida]